MIHGHHAMPTLIFNPKDRLPGMPGKKAVACASPSEGGFHEVPSCGFIFPDF